VVVVRLVKTDGRRGRLVTTVDPAQRSFGRRAAVASTSVAYLSLLVVEIVMAVGFSFRLAGADPSWPVVEWMYACSDHFVMPFREVLEPVTLGAGIAADSLVDIPVLLAMFVFGLVALILRAIIVGLHDPIEGAGARPQPPRSRATRVLQVNRP
jgi:hypothetical protein